VMIVTAFCFSFLKLCAINQKVMNIQDALKDDNVKIIDVRSMIEFQMGHVSGSINIPLNEIPQHVDEFKIANGPMVFCCASGGRSGQAVNYLQENGIKNICNGGGWMNVNFELSKIQG
jgi:rhodanese-related sulfurtransferase